MHDGPVELFSEKKELLNRFDSISAALHAAGHNYVLKIAPGTYRENLTIENAVRLEARDGPERK